MNRSISLAFGEDTCALDALEVICRVKKLNRGRVIRQLIREYVAQHPDIVEIRRKGSLVEDLPDFLN